jgi:hypothetical protein
MPMANTCKHNSIVFSIIYSTISACGTWSSCNISNLHPLASNHCSNTPLAATIVVHFVGGVLKIVLFGFWQGFAIRVKSQSFSKEYLLPCFTLSLGLSWSSKILKVPQFLAAKFCVICSIRMSGVCYPMASPHLPIYSRFLMPLFSGPYCSIGMCCSCPACSL